MRRVEYWGTRQVPQAETFQPRRPVWPDIDRPTDATGTPLPGTYWDPMTHVFSGLRAISLAPDTDWDQVLIRFNGDQEWRLLTPGVMLMPSGGAVDGFEAAPAVRCPSTRLYNAAPLRGMRNPLPPVTTAWQFDNRDGGTKGMVINVSGGPLPYYKWNGNAWINTGTVANGAGVPGMQAAGRVGPIAATNRASDFSPDAAWSFADYLETGLVALGWIGPTSGLAYVSAALVGAHGNAGDPTNPTTIKYSTVFAKFGGPSPLWYARLAFDCYEDECPQAGYRPPVAPERVISLGAITVPANASAGIVPMTPVVTVPALNVDEVQWTLRTGAGADVYVAIGSPLPDERIDAVAQLLTATATIPASTGGATLRGENVHDFIQIAVGSPTGGAAGSILAGSQLILRRRSLG